MLSPSSSTSKNEPERTSTPSPPEPAVMSSTRKSATKRSSPKSSASTANGHRTCASSSSTAANGSPKVPTPKEIAEQLLKSPERLLGDLEDLFKDMKESGDRVRSKAAECRDQIDAAKIERGYQRCVADQITLRQKTVAAITKLNSTTKKPQAGPTRRA